MAVSTTIKKLLQGGSSVLELEDPAGTLCSLAARGEKEQLRLLLSLGADPNVGDYDKRTPLHLAASEGHLECVKLLLNYWAAVNPVDCMKGTPLADAVRHGHLEVQKYLRERGGRLVIDPVELGTTLCEAAATGDLQKIQILAENGADINQALHLAACCNKLSIIEYLVSIPTININPLDRTLRTPLDDALREGQEAIASILKKKGGLQGQDPRLDEARHAHLEAMERSKQDKVRRREAKMNLFAQQMGALERILEIYHTMSEHLPPLFKYMNLLSVTLRSRRNTGIIDRTPTPSLQEVRTYFCLSFHEYLEKNYIKLFDTFLTLCEGYTAKQSLGEQALAAERVFQCLDSRSRGYINMDPDLVAACRENFRDCLQKGRLPRDLLETLEACVKQQLEDVLPQYFTSREYYMACCKRNGFLWRVLRLCRLAYSHCLLLLDRGMRPLLDMWDLGELECVPHFTPSNRARLRGLCERLEKHLVRLKRSLHIIAYLSKDLCVREAIRESHASKALEGKQVDGVMIRRRNS